MKYTLFYNGPFSQWYRSQFVINGLTYLTAEQYMMAEKARLFADPETEAKIMLAVRPHDQKALGRQVKNFDVDKWNAIARDVVYRGSWAKFSQNPELLEKLLSTKHTLLVEASPTDKLWGIGLALGDPAVDHPDKWRGTNWLGEVLTKVREDLSKGAQTTENFGWSKPVHVYTKPPAI
jgi:ribA/ribD-fused uncharacterized protein